MPISEAQRRAKNKYEAKTYKEIRIKPKIEEAERIHAHAIERDETLTRFLVRAAETQIEIDKDGIKDSANKNCSDGQGGKQTAGSPP